MKSVTIYCASSPDAPQKFIDLAYDLGREAALGGYATVTGAGTTGLMGATVRGTLSVPSGCARGVIPQFMVDRGWANPDMTELVVTADMAERKKVLADMGQGAIALPGGLGTLDELMDLLTRRQLGLYSHPIVILNAFGFYDALLAQLAHADSCAMMRHLETPGPLWRVATTPAEAIQLLTP